LTPLGATPAGGDKIPMADIDDLSITKSVTIDEIKVAVVPDDATTDDSGVVELALDAEAQTGTATDKVLTPANLQAVTGTTTRAGVLELANATEANTGTDSTRAMTSQMVKTAGTGVMDMWVPAPAMTLSVNAPATAIASINSGDQNVTVSSIAFADGSDTVVTFNVVFPESWNAGTVTAQFLWTNSNANAGSVVWGIRGFYIGDSGALNTDITTNAEEVTNANITTAGDLMVSPATGAITITGAASGVGITFFDVYRNGDDGSDSYTANAHLIGVLLHYTTEALTDDA